MPFLDPEEFKPKLKEIFENVVIPQIKRANMKQTAMQEHIEWLKATIEMAEEQSPILVNALKLCLNDATQRLEMEKEQIKDAYIIGRRGGTIKEFNETFKSE